MGMEYSVLLQILNFREVRYTKYKNSLPDERLFHFNYSWLVSGAIFRK